MHREISGCGGNQQMADISRQGEISRHGETSRQIGNKQTRGSHQVVCEPHPADGGQISRSGSSAEGNVVGKQGEQMVGEEGGRGPVYMLLRTDSKKDRREKNANCKMEREPTAWTR
eukprot:292238-Chlamydomonas_euryale.AAC.2